MLKRGVLRVLDANFNRCKEGLRVIEDIFRFVLNEDKTRKKIRRIRHSLDTIIKETIVRDAIRCRDSRYDLGRKVDSLELRRSDCYDVLYINIQRVKESLRVLEEFFKIILPRKVSFIKKIRYTIYTLEKDIFFKKSSFRN